MQIIKLAFICIFCIQFNEAGLMDRFKSSYNWIYKVDYKINLWPIGKKENATVNSNQTTDHLNKVNLNETSNSSEPNLLITSTIIITNQTESFTTPVSIANQTAPSSHHESNLTTSSSIDTGSDLISLISNENSTILSDRLDSVINQTESNPIGSSIDNELTSQITSTFQTNFTTQQIDSNTANHTSSTTAEPTESSETTTTEQVLTSTEASSPIQTRNDFVSSSTESTSTPNSTTELLNTFVQQTNATDAIRTESIRNTTTKLEQQSNLPATTVSESMPLVELVTTTIASNEIKQPVESVNSSTTSADIVQQSTEASKLQIGTVNTTNFESQLSNQTASVTERNLNATSSTNESDIEATTLLSTNDPTVETTSKEPIIFSTSTRVNTIITNTPTSTSTSASFSTSSSTSISTSFSTLTSESFSTSTSTSTSSTSSTPKTSISKATTSKPNTPIVIKYLNLKSLTSGKRLKNKAAEEDDNVIYRDIHKTNYLKEKLDEAFVKFINTFYFNFSSTRRN